MNYIKDIKEGDACVTYPYQNQTYDQCIKVEFDKALKNIFGCLPWWTQGFIPVTSDNLCPMRIKDFYARNGTELTAFTIFNLLDNQELLNKCLPPCISVTYKLDMIKRYNHRVGASQAEITWSNDVKVLNFELDVEIY